METQKILKQPSPGILRADAVIMKILRGISYISAVAIIIIMVVATIDVALVKIIKTGIPMSAEIIQYCHVPVVFFAVAFVTLDRGHIVIDFLSCHFPPRVQSALTMLGDAVGTFIMGFIGCRAFVRMVTFFTTHKMSSTSIVSFPLWPFEAILGIGSMLLAFSFVWAIVRMVNGMNPVSGSNPDMEEAAK